MLPFKYIRTVSRSFTRISLKINSKGEVIVSAPKILPQFLLDQFVLSKQVWVMEQLAKLATHQTKLAKNSPEPNTAQIFGKTLPMIITSDQTQPPSAKLTPTIIKVNVWLIPTPKPTHPKVRAALIGLLKRTATSYILTRTQSLAKIMNQTYKNVSLKAQKTRWGSCSSQGNLNFNWRLIHHPPAVIDYVIIHELAHRKHMDHSPAFWKFVAQFDPAHKQHRGWLKRHGEATLE